MEHETDFLNNEDRVLPKDTGLLMQEDKPVMLPENCVPEIAEEKQGCCREVEILAHDRREASLKHLRLLARDYPSVAAASGKILHLEMMLSLPKGTEYFFSDLHGEAGAFIHLLRSASGTVRQKIGVLYDNLLSEEEQNQLANLVYDPDRILEMLEREERITHDWKRITSYRLVELLRFAASKYTRSRVRLKTPPEYYDIIEELMCGRLRQEDHSNHAEASLRAVVNSPNFKEFIRAICFMIQNICVDQLHILGDIFDRGPGPHDIIEELMTYPDVDIEWGNHDVVWMGAASGSEVCMANVVRVATSYNNFDCLEDGYAINLRPLYSFASEVYADDPCTRFLPKLLDENRYDRVDPHLTAKMHKAIAIIQFKLEGQLLKRHPEFNMSDRIVLEKLDLKNKRYVDNGKSYPLLDENFPTIDPADPLKLTAGEKDVLRALRASFRHGEALRRHINFLFNYGSTYLNVNSNLLFHGCIPMTEEGEFQKTYFLGKELSGKALMDGCRAAIRDAWFTPFGSARQRKARDLMYYFWCGKFSPMFGKSKIATFENYFVEDKAIRKEVFNPYYKLVERPEICNKIFEEFGMNPDISHIINGHVPVKIKDGESPMKAGGKYFVIDGGISKAYQPKTGIAGYTMIFNSHDLALVEHTRFGDIENDSGSYMPEIKIVEHMPRRLKIADTNKGQEIRELISDLQDLIVAYEKGFIRDQADERRF